MAQRYNLNVNMLTDVIINCSIPDSIFKKRNIPNSKAMSELSSVLSTLPTFKG